MIIQDVSELQVNIGPSGKPPSAGEVESMVKNREVIPLIKAFRGCYFTNGAVVGLADSKHTVENCMQPNGDLVLESVSSLFIPAWIAHGINNAYTTMKNMKLDSQINVALLFCKKLQLNSAQSKAIVNVIVDAYFSTSTKFV